MVIIALFSTSTINLAALIGAVVGLGLFFHLHDRRRVRGWYWYLPLALVIRGLTYTSGVHATVAGVARGLLLRVAKDDKEGRFLRPLLSRSETERRGGPRVGPDPVPRRRP